MIKLHRVLCPTDFSEYSHKAVRYGCELAVAFSSELHLLHVVQNYDAIAPGSGEIFVPFTDWLPQLREQSQQRLTGLPGPDWEPRLKVERSTRVGQAIDEIVNYAKEHEIDLIVQSTHGRTGFKHFLLGSVAESIVRYAPCPVLTVRQVEHEFVEP